MRPARRRRGACACVHPLRHRAGGHYGRGWQGQATWLAAEDVADDTRAEVAAVRAEMAAGVVADHSVERSILALCGGQAWATGRGFPSLQGGGMGPRAARYLEGKRGVRPSASSVEEAAAAAVAAVWEAWTHLEAFLGGPSLVAHVGTLRRSAGGRLSAL